MNGRVVWWNGELIPEAEARISIYDSACMFGDMCFEMTRSFNRKQFKLKAHIDRLYDSCRWLHIPVPLSKGQMIDAVYRTIEANQPTMAEDDEHRVMINVTRGLLGIYQGVVGVSTGPNVIIADFPLRWTVKGMGKLFDEGINAVIPSQRSIPASLLEPKAKTRSRMHLMRANIQASQFRGKNNWPLLLDPDGFITEGTGDNFFIVKAGVLYTPQGRNILRGISRAYVMEMARQIEIPCETINMEPFDVLQADEAFMTGTPFCILPVVSLDGQAIGSGLPGSFTSLLLAAWGEDVDVDIRRQIQSWDVEGGPSGSTPYQFQEA